MKPEKLIISAFGPYAEEIEIDFEKLGDRGLFLITEIRGPGKRRFSMPFPLPCTEKPAERSEKRECFEANMHQSRRPHLQS